MSDTQKPTFRREILNIVEFSLPSGPIRIEHELGMIRVQDQSGGDYMFPESDIEIYVEAFQLMANQIKSEKT